MRPETFDVFAVKVSRRAVRNALALNAVGYVSRHGDRAKYFVFGAAFDDREGHFDVYFASALVQRAGQRRATLKLRRALCHRSFEAAPV